MRKYRTRREPVMDAINLLGIFGPVVIFGAVLIKHFS